MMEVDVQAVIENLVAQIGTLTYEVAVLKAQVDQLSKQQNEEE